jgi:acyl-CoA reductase-like NAD-dependent aldehyde dehydrogenase
MLQEIVKYPLSIDGITSTEFVDVKSPYSGEIVASVGQADEQAIDTALALSKKCFEQTMKTMPAYQRSEILAKTAELIKANIEDLARTIAMEGGKPIKDARVEVSRAANTFAIASREALRLDGEQLQMDTMAGNEARVGIIMREPVGVVAAVTPFNFPLNLVAHKLAPAIAGGNTVVLKPSSNTPVSSFKLAALMKQAGLPDHALILTPCRGSKGNALVRDKRLAVLTFTGKWAGACAVKSIPVCASSSSLAAMPVSLSMMTPISMPRLAPPAVAVMLMPDRFASQCNVSMSSPRYMTNF